MFGILKKSGRYPWKSEGNHQTSIGLFANAAERIFAAHPDTKDDLMKMIEVYGNLHDDICREAFPNDPDAKVSLADVIIERIFKK